jgi:hypothetical protein
LASIAVCGSRLDPVGEVVDVRARGRSVSGQRPPDRQRPDPCLWVGLSRGSVLVVVPSLIGRRRGPR